MSILFLILVAIWIAACIGVISILVWEDIIK